MSDHYLLIDHKWCTGCRSCEFACNMEHKFPVGLSGLKVVESIVEAGGRILINYIPIPTSLCSLCPERVKKSKLPACVQHCQAQCIKYEKVERLIEYINREKPKAIII
ncbi:MAG: oxidoreductase [Candidatus Bathyarchaeia archaeon]